MHCQRSHVCKGAAIDQREVGHLHVQQFKAMTRGSEEQGQRGVFFWIDPGHRIHDYAKASGHS